MRYAIFSDVHANLRAWERALADIREQQADVLVCLGDVVGYGPKPEEVLRGIREVTGNFVMGNHDAAATGLMDYSIFNEQAQHSIRWTAAALSEESREFLSAVPLAIDAEEILFVHAEISEPGRFMYIDCPESAEENFADNEHFVTFVGHTHYPNLFQLEADGSVVELPGETCRLDPDKRYIVNVGSVGEPRNPEDLRGVYVVYDSETREVDYRRIPFDIEAYRSDLDSSTLEVTPFFLQCYDHKIAAHQAARPVAAQALAMEAPASRAALVSKQRAPVKLSIPSRPLGASLAPPEEDPAQRRARRLVAPITIVTILAIVSVIWAVSHFQQRGAPDDEIEPIVVEEIAALDEASEMDSASETRAGDSSVPDPEAPSPDAPAPADAPQDAMVASVAAPPEAPGGAPKADDAKAAAMTGAPAGGNPESDPDAGSPDALPSPPDSTVAWWRMEADSAGGDLVDQIGGHSLPAEVPGTEIGGLAPAVVPGTGDPNSAALSLGVWTEPDPKDLFELQADRSFTLEGWVLTDTSSQPIFLAGTRSGEANDSQGWHVDLRPASRDYPNGQMCFFYDNGEEILQALSEDVIVADLLPHHFAAVWDHDAMANAGEMRLFVDGKQVATTRVPHRKIPQGQANPFRVGAPTNPPRLAMDELRFSRDALGARYLLNQPREKVLFGSSFEKPDVDGYHEGSTPGGWIGSSAGAGSEQRGLIDQGVGEEFTTQHGEQAYILNYTNSGLTSSVGALDEVLTAGNTYRIELNVGSKKGEKASYRVQLVAFSPETDNSNRRDVRNGGAGTVLAEATGETNKHDLSKKVTVEFEPDVASPHLGKRLAVRLLKAQGNAIYDNVRFVSVAEDPAAAALAARGSAAASSDPEAPAPASPAAAPATGQAAPKGDATVAWWRMESVADGATLADQQDRHPLAAEVAGQAIAAVAPETLPSNGVDNQGALGSGVYLEPKPAGAFALRADRSFTLEGWVVTARQRTPIFLAGTRSGEAGDGQGWHVDVRPRSNEHPNGQMCFFYDTGPDIVQALSDDVAVSDLVPHHFAAVWDHAAAKAAGEMRLYLDGELIATTKLPHAQIPSGQANPFRIGASTNPAKVGLDELRFSHAALGPLEFLRIRAQQMNKNGKWEAPANWSGGEPPSGTQTAVVGAKVTAVAEVAPPKFGGDLVLMPAAKLTLKGESHRVIPEAPARIVLHQGAALIVTAGPNQAFSRPFGPIQLMGSATIWGGQSTSGHHSDRTFASEISGPGALVLNGVNNNTFVLQAANSFRGGLVAKSTQNQDFLVRAAGPGSLGAGNVEIAAHASLALDAPEAVARTATLTLTGTKSERAAAKVELNADNTVAALVIDGEPQATGTWGAPRSGADHELELFGGSGTLTVGR